MAFRTVINQSRAFHLSVSSGSYTEGVNGYFRGWKARYELVWKELHSQASLNY